MNKYYVADFETSSKIFFKDGFLDANESEAYIWLFCVMNTFDTNSYFVGNNIEEFFEYVSTLGKKRDVIHIDFHNLKFDGHYLMYYILNNNFNYNSLSNKYLKERDYKTLIDGLGKWYSVTIKLNGRIIVFEDSLKKLPFSVSELGEMLNLDEKKGDIDYNKFRGKDYVANDDEIDYVRRDCKVVAEALNKVLYSQNYYGLTIGSNCFKEYKESLRNYDILFPFLNDKIDNFCRKAYIGGLCQKGDHDYYKGNITVIDKNSMYPSMLHSVSKNIYPAGTPIYFKGKYINDDIYCLYIQRFTCDIKLKEGHFGFIQTKGFMLGSTFITEEEGIELTLTNVDIDTLFKNYEVSNIKYIDGYKFMACYKRFDDYINKWYKIKEEATIKDDKALRLLAKLFLNNLYGKFGTAGGGTNTTLELDDNYEMQYIHGDNNKKSVYVPVAAFCTAYARRDLLENVEKMGLRENVLYMDTDSIHIKDIDVNDVDINLHDTNLNCWSIEGIATEGHYIRQKTYAEKINGYWDIKACGCPKACKSKINVETDFKVGMKVEGKLSTMKLKGGIILVETTFTIK